MIVIYLIYNYEPENHLQPQKAEFRKQSNSPVNTGENYSNMMRGNIIYVISRWIGWKKIISFRSILSNNLIRCWLFESRI